MKILIIGLILLSGCQGYIDSERIKKAVEFCEPFGGIYELKIDSTFDYWDVVYCFDRGQESIIDIIKK